MEDPIQNLLSSMGWSCDDLLEKLQQYKNISKANVDTNPTQKTQETSDNKPNAIDIKENNISKEIDRNLDLNNIDQNLTNCTDLVNINEIKNDKIDKENNSSPKINDNIITFDDSSGDNTSSNFCDKNESSFVKENEKIFTLIENNTFDISNNDSIISVEEKISNTTENTFNLNKEIEEETTFDSIHEAAFKETEKHELKNEQLSVISRDKEVINVIPKNSKEGNGDKKEEAVQNVLTHITPEDSPKPENKHDEETVNLLANKEINDDEKQETTENISEDIEETINILIKNLEEKHDDNKEKPSDKQETKNKENTSNVAKNIEEQNDKVEEIARSILDDILFEIIKTQENKNDEETVNMLGENDNNEEETQQNNFSGTDISHLDEKEKSQDVEEDETEPEPKHDEEEIRNLLRMQISQLRNKKKVDVISSTLDKNLLSRELPESKKKKRKLITEDENKIPSPKKPHIEDESNKKDDLENVLLSNESDILIVNVVGGYKSPEREDETPKVLIINEHLEGEPIYLKKTNSYKKVKGWQRKKFVVQFEETEAPVKKPFFDEAVPSCSCINPPSVTKPIEEKSEGNKNINSAFESNLLDKFLVEHSRLNISYEVPKLDAEENITHDELLVPVKSFDANLDKIIDNVETKKPLERYKPKTLAEKRKMIQRIERKKAKEREELNTIKTYTSRIYCRGKILKVRTREPYGGFLYYITKRGASRCSRKSTKKTSDPLAKRQVANTGKPKLLTCLKTPDTDTVCYKPGPLSMKLKLQNEYSANEWTTVIKKLPKITLEVTPQYRKPLDPRILNYINFNSEIIDENRIDFALTAIKSEEENNKTFTFDVNYKNDEKFLLLRKYQPQIREETVEPIIEDDETAVKTVINKLLNYVEVSEIADSLIKPDTEQRAVAESDTIKPLTPISSNIDAIIKNSRKKRTSLELRRLNVKIIDVDVAEEENKEICTKQFCKMGCVCQSLECNRSYNFHCGNVECMLECTCNDNKLRQLEDRVVLPAGTNILSVGTVSRLQNQAKRNLAKEEKEFVQTVIQANDQTIILGSGTRDRQRRATKLPRKMSDYISHNVIDKDRGSPEIPVNATKRVQDDFIQNKCSVNVQRLDFTDIIPYCLEHNMYDCHCGNLAPYTAAPDPIVASCLEEPKREEKVDVSSRTEASRKYEVKYRERSPQHCSKTKQVATEAYRRRNSRVGYLDNLRKTLAMKERWLGLNISSPPKPMPPIRNMEPPVKIHKRKQQFNIRKDHGIEIISIPPEKAIQRRKKRRSIGTSSRVPPNPLENQTLENEEKNQVEVKPPTEAKPRSLMEELGKFLGKNTKSKLQLLPWETLVNRYNDGTLQVWCNLRAKKLLITEDRTRPSRNYINVNYLQQSVYNKEQIEIDILRCLITNRVPKNKDPKEVLLILTFKNTYFEVRGICEKSNGWEDVSLSLIKSDLNEQQEKQKDVSETFVHKTMSDQLKEIPLTKMDYPPRTLIYQTRDYNLKKVQHIMHVPLPDISEGQRWCMVLLTRKFSYLMFPTIKYSIKKSDIYDLIKLARNCQKTIVLQAKHFNTENYDIFPHDIYIVPSYNNRIFVGPYNKTQDANIETLDFVHSVLVNTDLYCKMKGALSANCAWVTQVYEIPSTATNTRSLLRQNSLTDSEFITIDDDESAPVQNYTNDFELVLIEDDEEKTTDSLVEPTSSPTPTDIFATIAPAALTVFTTPATITVPTVSPPVPTSVLTTPIVAPHENKLDDDDDDDDVVLVKDKEYIEQSNLKRYFITNVKGLGYVEGTQVPDSKIIDVKWPFTNNIQRYSKVEDAIGGIERQLNAMLIPVPKTFQLKVSVTENIDSSMQLVNVDYAHGSYAVGEFGICNILKTNPNEYPFSGGLNEELIEMLLHRCSKVLLHNCIKLTETFTASQHPVPYDTISGILSGAQKEIKYQENLFDTLNKNKLTLEIKKAELKKKLKSLKIEVYSKQGRKRRFKKYPNKSKATKKNNDKPVDLIEISDDDEDAKKQQDTTTSKENEEAVKVPTKIVPPLVKITKSNSTKDGTKFVISPLNAKSTFKTKRNLVKVPIGTVLSTNVPVAKKLVLSLKENSEPDIIKRLKMSSGLQVSVLDQEIPSSPATQDTAANPLLVQQCDIVTVKDKNNIKRVALKRVIPQREFQSLVKKQLVVSDSKNSDEEKTST